MGIFEKREAELNLKLSVDSKKAYEALLNAFNNAGLNLKSEDKYSLSAVAERPKLEAMVNNSYGEVVTFFITEPEQADCCFANITSKGNAPVGSYSHKAIFLKIQESLQKDLGVTSVQFTVQSGDFYIDEVAIFKSLEEKIDRKSIRDLAEKYSIELQDVSNSGGNVYQTSLEQQDKINEFSVKLSEDDAITFMTIYSEELEACSKKKMDDANEILAEANANVQNTQVIGNIVGIVIVLSALFFIFR